ncbi:hypothetical protein [Streptomyces sp. NPDC057580]|uniref:hypothetical protein n=1 Tax=Streptomyces sp. NPDC057580 TaxID=3346173 RepID=UPI00369DCDC9
MLEDSRLAGERPSFRRMVWRRAGNRPYDAALTSAVATFPTLPGIAPFAAEDLPMPFRRITALAAVSVTVLLLASCGSSKVHGTVTEKEYKPARTTWTTEPVTKRQCTTSRSNGKTKRSCRTVRTGTHRVSHRHPACWQIELNDDAHELCISKSRWDKVRVGDRW